MRVRSLANPEMMEKSIRIPTKIIKRESHFVAEKEIK